MNTTKNILISFIFTFWILAIATFSIQNIELVSLNFFFLESIQIPVGILLAIMLGLGFFIGALIPLLFVSKKKKVKTRKKKNQFIYEREKELESDPIFSRDNCVWD